MHVGHFHRKSCAELINFHFLPRKIGSVKFFFMHFSLKKKVSKTFSRSFFTCFFQFNSRFIDKEKKFRLFPSTIFHFIVHESQNARNFFSLKRKMEPFFLFEKYKSAIFRVSVFLLLRFLSATEIFHLRYSLS